MLLVKSGRIAHGHALPILQLLAFAHFSNWALLGSATARPEEQLVAVRPLTFVIPDFASPSECQDILELIEICHRKESADCQETKSHLAKKPQNKSDAGGHSRPLRNSTSFMLTLHGEINGTVDALVKRSHLLARHPITHGEGVQIASYHAGDYYGFHHDSLMRRATLLVYLTDIPEGDGGETIFPLVRAPGVPEDAKPPLPPAVTGQYSHGLDFKVKNLAEMTAYCASDFYLKIRPERGKAILFFSYGPDYKMDEYAVHGACPLRRGHKAILQRWMRFEENSLMEKGDEAVKQARVEWGHDRNLKPIIQPESESQPEAKGPSLRASIERLHRRYHGTMGHMSDKAGTHDPLGNDSVTGHHHRPHTPGSAAGAVNPWEL